MSFEFNQNLWSQVWNLPSIPPDENRYTRVICPILLSTTAVAVILSIPGAVVDPWRFGGYISREVVSGLIVGGQPSAKLDSSFKIYVNRLQIITYPLKINNYSLVFDTAFNGDVQFFAWEYTGVTQ